MAEIIGKVQQGTAEKKAEQPKRTKLQSIGRFLITAGFGGGVGFLVHSDKLDQSIFAGLVVLLVVAYFGLETYAEKIADKWLGKDK